jgi:hypothetical protein
MAAHVRPLQRNAARRLPALAAAVLAAASVSCGSSSDEPQRGGPYPRPQYQLLSQTGLYTDIAAQAVTAEARAFVPSFPLWSDGADKARWVALPAGTAIETLDMDRWVFPIGTRFWKQFSLAGVPLETRLIERYGSGRDDYWMGAFVWNEAQTDAELSELGRQDLLGTPHDAPAQEDCGACHNGEPGRVLGFSALQLAAAGSNGELDLTALVNEGRLSHPPDPAARYRPPGDDVTASALGYLHANCGHCHNSRGTSWPDTQMVLRLFVSETTSESTSLVNSIVGQELDYYRDTELALRVAPGEPEASAVIERMRTRETKKGMPPLATEQLDEAGIAAVSAWVSTLAP